MSLTKGKEVIEKIAKQIESFQTGESKPIETGVPYIDYHLLGGLYPSIILGIAALSQMGKTWEVEKIQSNVEKRDDLVMLKCNWEISLFKAVVREMSKASDKSVREVLNEVPEEETKKIFDSIVERYKQDNIYLEAMAVTPDEFEKDVNDLIEKFPDKKILVTIDNLENVLLDGETLKQAMDRIVRIINVSKEKHPFINFIILNQLNWDIMDREKPKNHFPRAKDIYNSSAFFKLCDVVMVKHMPFRLGIEEYGNFSTNRYKHIDDKHKIFKTKYAMFKTTGRVFYHFLKSRDIPLEYDVEDLYCEQIFEADDEEEFQAFNEIPDFGNKFEEKDDIPF